MEANIMLSKPSLVLNITENCNMKCLYCPPYGENLFKGKGQIDLTLAKSLITLAKENKFQTVRLTGGEPLLYPLLINELLEECGSSFERLILHTNGTLLNGHFDWLRKYKSNIILKVSFDSLNPNEFFNLTQSTNLNIIQNNIDIAVSMGFLVEINTVLVDQSLDSIKMLISHFVNKKVPLKMLTLSNYYRKVKAEYKFDTDGLIYYLESISEKKTKEQLSGSRGIEMLKYIINDSIVSFIDHSCKSSKTPKKCYFNTCIDTCELFPCDSGALSISLNTEGFLSICRGNKKHGFNAFDMSELDIIKGFNILLKQFENCISINVNEFELQRQE